MALETKIKQDNPFTPDETNMLINALEASITSAKRQQNSKGRTPQMKVLWEQLARDMNNLLTKLLLLKQ